MPDPRPDDLERPWWETLPTFLHCYHPYADRYLICAVVEKCRICGEMRSAEAPNVASKEFWPAASKIMEA